MFGRRSKLRGVKIRSFPNGVAPEVFRGVDWRAAAFSLTCFLRGGGGGPFFGRIYDYCYWIRRFSHARNSQIERGKSADARRAYACSPLNSFGVIGGIASG